MNSIKSKLGRLDLIINMHLMLLNGVIGGVLTKQKGLLFAATTIIMFNILSNVFGILQPLIKRLKIRNTNIIISLLVVDILIFVMTGLLVNSIITMYIFLIVFTVLVLYTNCISSTLDFSISAKVSKELDEKELESYYITTHTLCNITHMVGCCIGYILVLTVSINTIMVIGGLIELASMPWSYKLYKLLGSRE